MGLLNPSRVHLREAGTLLKMIMMLVRRKIAQLFREPVSHRPGSWAGTPCLQGFQLRFVPPGGNLPDAETLRNSKTSTCYASN